MRTYASWGRLLPLLLGLAVLAGPASAAVTIDWVTVGNPGNPADIATNCSGLDGSGSASCGSVAEAYRISKFEVTNAQYAEFLNAKAKAGQLGLYNQSMADSAQGGINRILVFVHPPAFYDHAAKSGFENKPVNFVSFYDALRFINWLHNGQGNGDTETGAYTLLGGTAIPTNGTTVTANGDASVFLPSENEWYKAAYWDPETGSFFDYPAGSDDPTGCAAPGATPNTANCGNAVSGVTDVGAYTGSASPNGTFDQGGNVWEWNEQIAIVGSNRRGLRGGSWSNIAGNLAASIPNSNLPSVEDGSLGFRVASPVPEPQTSLPAVIALAGLAARRARRIRTL